MTENEIITQQDPQMQLFSQLMEGILKKLERYCATARPMLGGEVYLTGEEVCKLLRLSPRTLQDYRDNGTIAYFKIGGKILYRQSDIQAMLERHYNPIPQTGPSFRSHAGEEKEEQTEGLAHQRMGKQPGIPLEIEQYLVHDTDVQVHGKKIGIAEIIDIHH